MKTLTFRFAGYAGWDLIWSLFSKKFQTRVVAREWIRLMIRKGHQIRPDQTPMYLEMPWGRFRVLDTRGRVEYAPTEAL